MYREVLYLFLQRFVYRGQMVFFGTITNPVGCAVAYRRKYVEALFDFVGPVLGDDLTNSEDIFIGMGMLNEGYRNIQLDRRVCADGRAPMQPAVPSGVPLVVVFSPVLLLLRQSAPQPRSCLQAVDVTTPRFNGTSVRRGPRLASAGHLPVWHH